MVTLRQLDRVGMGQPEAALPAELLAGRAEDCLALQQLLYNSPVMAAAYAILRSTELGQSHRALVQQAALRLMQIQGPDDGWGLGAATAAVAAKALADQGAWTRQSVARALAHLERTQSPSGGYGPGGDAIAATALVVGMISGLREAPFDLIRRAAQWLKTQRPTAEVSPLVAWALRQSRRVLEEAVETSGTTARRQLWEPARSSAFRRPAETSVRASTPQRPHVDQHHQGLLWPSRTALPAAVNGG